MLFHFEPPRTPRKDHGGHPREWRNQLFFDRITQDLADRQDGIPVFQNPVNPRDPVILSNSLFALIRVSRGHFVLHFLGVLGG
jgi:hypothetical protein